MSEIRLMSGDKTITLKEYSSDFNLYTKENNLHINSEETKPIIKQTVTEIDLKTSNKTISIKATVRGEKGVKGENGVGVIAGGVEGQVLAKKTSDDYDTEWVNQTGGSGVEQIQSDWNQANTEELDYIKNKPTIPDSTSDLTNDSGFITSGDIPTIPSKTSELENDSGYITEEDIPAIPVTHSDLTELNGDNDYLHLTATEKAMIGQAKGIVNNYEDLPATAVEGDLYFVTEETPSIFEMSKTYTEMHLNQLAPTPTSLGIINGATYESDFICDDSSPLYVLAYATDILGHEALNIAIPTYDEITLRTTVVNYLKFFEDCTATIFSEQSYKTGWNYQVTVMDVDNTVVSDTVTQIDPDVDIVLDVTYEAQQLAQVDVLAQIVTPNKIENPTLYIYYNGVWVKASDDVFKENISNKVTIINENSTDGQYPSAKAVYNAIDSIDIPTGDYLKLDQSTPETVTGGTPIFEGGIAIPTPNNYSYYATNCPVKWNGIDCYIGGDGEEDIGISCLWYIDDNLYYFGDDGGVQGQQLIEGLTTQDINLHIAGANFGTEEEPYWVYFTGLSDLGLNDFATLMDMLLTEGAGLIVGIHTEVGFEFNSTLGKYEKVTELTKADDSIYTQWDEVNMSGVPNGFLVKETTADVEHLANYTNNNPDAIFKYKGQVKVGNGNLLGMITSSIVSNPVYDTVGDGLQFAMSFVPEVYRIGGVPGNPVSSSIYVSGIYGTTAIEGVWANLNGVALGMWSAIQNSLADGGGVSVDYGVGVRSGITLASVTDETLIIKDFTAFQSDVTSLNQGKVTSTNYKHFESKDMKVNDSYYAFATNNYGLYLYDNSTNATNSWGIYSLEPSNYARKLYLGATPTKPTEDLEVEANIKAGGYKSSDGSSGVSGSFTSADGKTITVKDGLITGIV